MIYDGVTTQKHYNNICLEVVAAVIHTTTYMFISRIFLPLNNAEHLSDIFSCLLL